jgi:hypothetical protein
MNAKYSIPIIGLKVKPVIKELAIKACI